MGTAESTESKQGELRQPRQGEQGRWYCGRKVDYHDGPHRWCATNTTKATLANCAGSTERITSQGCNCDGRCGPTNGCQCIDCYELTFPSAQLVRTPSGWSELVPEAPAAEVRMSTGCPEADFKDRVEAALKQIRLVLDNTKSPAIAEKVDHSYVDKYLLAETVTRAAITSTVNSLNFLGVDHEKLQRMVEWGATRAVSLKYECTTTCNFNREVQREEESPDKKVTSVMGVKFTSKVVGFSSAVSVS